MRETDYVDAMVRCWSNLEVYHLVAKAGPHRANALTVLVIVDRIHRVLFRRTIPQGKSGTPFLSAGEAHR